MSAATKRPSNPIEHLLSAFDGHDIHGIRAALDAGADACSPVRGKLPVYWLLEEYTRSDRLPACMELLFERGAVLDDPVIAPVLLDDAGAIKAAIVEDPSILTHRASLVSAFTSLDDVTLLHIAAEYGNRNAARALIDAGADVNARARVDENGFNGHTPIFHTVNSHANRSEPIMQMLIDAGADCTIRLEGLYWGKGYPWETVFFDVTPISYAQIGLMPQVHRQEKDIYSNIERLIGAAERKMPKLENVPNRYIQPK
jgi:ankyrin repeat protein